MCFQQGTCNESGGTNHNSWKVLSFSYDSYLTQGTKLKRITTWRHSQLNHKWFFSLDSNSTSAYRQTRLQNWNQEQLKVEQSTQSSGKNFLKKMLELKNTDYNYSSSRLRVSSELRSFPRMWGFRFFKKLHQHILLRIFGGVRSQTSTGKWKAHTHIHMYAVTPDQKFGPILTRITQMFLPYQYM